MVFFIKFLKNIISRLMNNLEKPSNFSVWRPTLLPSYLPPLKFANFFTSANFHCKSQLSFIDDCRLILTLSEKNKKIKKTRWDVIKKTKNCCKQLWLKIYHSPLSTQFFDCNPEVVTWAFSCLILFPVSSYLSRYLIIF